MAFNKTSGKMPAPKGQGKTSPVASKPATNPGKIPTKMGNLGYRKAGK